MANKTRKKKKKQKIKLTEKLLEMFRGGSPLTFSETMKQIYGLPIYKRELTHKQLYDTVEKVRKQGWLEKKVIEDQIFYSLTAKGRIKHLVYKLKTATKRRGERATIIIFDIPEEKRTYRNFLRRVLKQMKFNMIQKSVFIAPYTLPKEFYELLKEMDLLKFINVIEGTVRF